MVILSRILCLHTRIDLDKKKARIWRLNLWRVKVRHLPATRLEFEPFFSSPPSRLPPSCPFRHFSPPFQLTQGDWPWRRHPPQHRLRERQLHYRTPSLSHPHGQIQATQPPSPLKQLGSVFFPPFFSNRCRTTATTSSSSRPPSCSGPRAEPHARTSTSPAAQVSPLRAHKPPLYRHLAALGPT